MEEEKKQNRILAFLEKKDVRPSARLYFVNAMGSMATALFATLLMGTILSTLGAANALNLPFLVDIASAASGATGIMLGIAIAATLKAPPLVMYSAGVVGAIANSMVTVFDGAEITGGPATVFFCAIIATEVGKLVSKETKIDILVTPVVTMLVGYGAARLLATPVSLLMYWLGSFVNNATTIAPVPMGILIAVVVGIVLTLPISSAALCAMIGISGVAGGAAVAGCCAQMIGFAVISFRENRVGGLVAQGLGTSMLQMGNIVKNPRIWIPPTLASAITGPLATAVFSLKCNGVSAGMGTCGLVGPLGVLTATPAEEQSWFFWLGLVLICFVLPALLSLAFSELLRRVGWIKDGDMKLDL